MTEVPDSDSEEQERYFSAMRQGDTLDGRSVGSPLASARVAVVSQTCDVVQPKREFVTVAAIVSLEGDEEKRALSAVNPRYLELTGEGFVDLAQIVSLSKVNVFGSAVRRVFSESDHLASRDFSLRIGRWFSRFAVPDAIAPWLGPVVDVVRSKYNKPASPLGKLLRRLAEIRVECDDWYLPAANVQLHVIAKAGEIPFLDEPPTVSAAFARRFFDSADELRTPAEVAVIMDARLSADEEVYAWGKFVEALAASCKPHARWASDDEVRGAVQEVTGVLWSDDEFTLSHVRKSEPLDVDYLSEPTPFGQQVVVEDTPEVGGAET